MSRPTAAVAALVAALTSACAAPQPDEVSRAETTGPVGPAPAPVQHADGTCWAREVTPAIYEHVSGDQRAYHEQVTDEGTLLHLPIFRRAVAPKVLRPREDVSFEAPCPALMTYDFTASLQRALDPQIPVRTRARQRSALARHRARAGPRGGGAGQDPGLTSPGPRATVDPSAPPGADMATTGQGRTR